MSMIVSATLPDGTKHTVSLTQTGPDSAVILDQASVVGAGAPQEQSYRISNIRRSGDEVTANLPRIFLFTPKITFTLLADHVQLVAPGHNMAYPVTAAEHAEAESFIDGFPNVAAP